MLKQMYDHAPECIAVEKQETNKFRQQLAYLELKRTLHLARIRCLGPTEVVARLPGIIEDSDRDELLIRLGELELTDEQVEDVSNVVRMLAVFGDTLPSRQKPKVDVIIARIVKLLPKDTANELAKPMLDHPRRARREIAYKVLKYSGVTAAAANDLIANFHRTGDEKMLELVARTAGTVAEVDAEFLLQNLSEDYWRARVLESLIHHLPQRAAELAGDYPREFIWAVGRAKADAFLPLMERIAELNMLNFEILSIYAWALGQLGAEKQLQRLSERIQQDWPDGIEVSLCPWGQP